MDKQQAAEAYANNWKSGSPFIDVSIASFKSGADWQAAQCPGDAQKFAMWAARFYRYEFSLDNWVNKADGSRLLTHELYQLFNPSGAAPQAKDNICETCGGDGFLKSNVQMPDGTFQIDCPQCEARNDAMDEYKELPAPKPAGPVWVNPESIPPKLDKLYYLRDKATKWKKYIGRFMHTENLGVVIRLHSEYDVCPQVHQIEYLDESAPQVFTREQVEDALFAGLGIGGIDVPQNERRERCREYMDTNFPQTNKTP